MYSAPYQTKLWFTVVWFLSNTLIKGSNFLVAVKLKLHVKITNIAYSVFIVLSSGSDFRYELQAPISIRSHGISNLLYSYTLGCVREYYY